MGGTCYEVIMAYAFNSPTLWNFDFSLQMYGAIFMMAGAYLEEMLFTDYFLQEFRAGLI